MCDRVCRNAHIAIGVGKFRIVELWNFFDNFLPESDLPIIRYLYWELLPNFSIADIACGSGEFLLAALKVFTPIYQQCIGFLQETPEFLEEQANIDYFPNQLSFIKYNILSNNIYGVDLQSGGVDVRNCDFCLIG